MRYPALTLFAIAMFWSGTPAAETVAVCSLALDGVNVVRYDLERPANSHGIFGLTSSAQDAASRIFEQRALSIGSAPCRGPLTLSATALAGSESGDPLLNAYQDPSLPNRDHIARLTLTADKGGAGLGVVREYNDLYSGRFDRIRSGNIPGGDYVHFALSEEDAAALALNSTHVRYEGSLSRYRRWRLTPLFFSPLYAQGTRSMHEGTITVDRSSLSLAASLDFQDRFETASAPKRQRYDRIAATGTHAITDSLCVTMHLERRSETSPRQAATGTCEWRTRRGAVTSWAGLYENGMPVGGAIARIPVPFVQIEGSIEQRYEPAGEPFSFIHGPDTVRYDPAGGSLTTAHFACESGRSHGANAFSARLWVDYIGSTFMEAWSETAPHRITARRILLDQYGSCGGLSCAGHLRKGAWSIAGRAAAQTLFGTTVQPLHVPWFWQCRLSYGSTARDSLMACVSLEGNGPVSLTTHSCGVMRTESIPSREAVSFRLRLPFRVPLFSAHIASVFSLEAGPFCLAPEGAALMHPYGNPIGPTVAIQFGFSLKP